MIGQQALRPEDPASDHRRRDTYVRRRRSGCLRRDDHDEQPIGEGLSRGLIAAVVAAAVMTAPGLTGTSGASAAADPTCGSWISSLVFPGLSARACIWGTGAAWKQAQTEVFNGTGFSVEVENLTARLEALPADARCVHITLQNGQTAFCGTRSVPDNNPFQFDRALGSAQVTDLVRREQFSFESPFVG